MKLRKPDLIEEVGRRKKEIIKLCSDLIRLKGENPPGETLEIGMFIRDKLERDGLSVEVYEPKKNVVNLISIINKKARPRLILCGHLDVFPATESSWQIPPFEGRIVDDRIYGRGAVDMKAGLAAAATTLLILSNCENELNGSLAAVFFSDEESMGFWGAQWMLQNVKETRGDACLIGEPAGADVVTIAEKGIWWFRLVTHGKLAHGAYTGGDNAIVKMSRAITGIERLKNVEGFPPTELLHILRSQQEMLKNRGLGHMAQALSRVWVNCGVIRGGDKINLVPWFCESEFDMRIPLGLDVEELKLKLEESLKSEGVDDFTYQTIFEQNPNFTSPNEKIVQIALNNVRDIVKMEPHMFCRLGSTDAKFFRKYGIPTVTYGPDMKGMGEVDEYVKIEELIYTTKVHLGVACDYLELM